RSFTRAFDPKTSPERPSKKAENQPSNYDVILAFLRLLRHVEEYVNRVLGSGLDPFETDFENCGLNTEFLDETFLRSSDKCLGPPVKKFEQLADPAVVELGVQIVEKEERIFASSRVKDGDVGEL